MTGTIEWPAWSSEDQAEFASLEARWTERAKFPITIRRQLDRWANFTISVEGGYGDNRIIEEYWNDLDSRKLLQEALNELTPDLAGRLQGAIEPWDTRFREATVERLPPMWQGGWWACRIPKNPAPSFARELRFATRRHMTRT